METIDIGKIKFEWKGLFNILNNYERDDVVKFNNSAYICVSKDNENKVRIAPSGTSNADWDLMAEGIDQLTTKGDLASHDGTSIVRVPSGAEGQFLKVKADKALEWSYSTIGTTVSDIPDADGHRVNIFGGGVVLADNTIRTWGDGLNYTRGDALSGAINGHSVIPYLDTAATVIKWKQAAFNNWLLLSDGTVWSYGVNAIGELGHGSTTAITTPKQIMALSGIVDVVVSTGRDRLSSVFFMKSDKNIFSCGANAYGQLGLGDQVTKTTPTLIDESLLWKKITGYGGGYSSIFGIATTDELYAWGNNTRNQLGNGNTSHQLNPQKIITSGTVTDISTTMGNEQLGSGSLYGAAYFYGHSCCLMSDKTIKTWGYGTSGQLGHGSTTSTSSPQSVSGLSNVEEVYCYGGVVGSTIVRTTDNNLYSFGANGKGQLGLGSTSNSTAPQLVAQNAQAKASGIKQIIAGYNMIVASLYVLYNNGEVYACGDNNFSKLGIVGALNITTLTKINLNRYKVKKINIVGGNFTNSRDTNLNNINRFSLGILTEEGHYLQTGTWGYSQFPNVTTVTGDYYSPIPKIATF